MVHLSVIEARLTHLGVKVNRFFRPEIRELQHILMDNEKIVSVVCGRYFAGFAMLVATEQRLLLIDKKIPYLSVEDIRYDMISEINFSNSLYSSTVNIFTVNKQHRFVSIRHRSHLRKLSYYAQQRVMELRQYQQQPNNFQPAVSYAPVPVQEHNAPAIALQQETVNSLPISPPTAIEAKPDYLAQSVGSAAVTATTPWVITNPYARGSLVSRRQSKGIIGQPTAYIQPEIS